MNRALLLAGLALILAAANWAIASREVLKSSGQLVYLELAPVDPRSLMQGDYMSLRYKIDLNTPGTAESGYLIIRLDDRHVAKAVGWNFQPAASELRLKYRSRYGRTSVGSDAFSSKKAPAVSTNPPATASSVWQKTAMPCSPPSATPTLPALARPKGTEFVLLQSARSFSSACPEPTPRLTAAVPLPCRTPKP